MRYEGFQIVFGDLHQSIDKHLRRFAAKQKVGNAIWKSLPMAIRQNLTRNVFCSDRTILKRHQNLQNAVLGGKRSTDLANGCVFGTFEFNVTDVL